MNRSIIAGCCGGEAIDEDRDLGDHGLVDVARHRDAAVALGERHHADRQRRPGLDLRQRRPARPAPGRPSRTNSDDPPPISNRITPDACGSISGVQPVAAELGLGLAVDDLELEPDLVGDAGAKFLAILGRAAGFGGDQPRARDAAVVHLVAADAERLDGARRSRPR